MRTFLAIIFLIGCLGFLPMMGYAIKTLFRDFGPVVGVLGGFCVAMGFVALGFLVDMRKPPEQK